jgi:hypothetical protein
VIQAEVTCGSGVQHFSGWSFEKFIWIEKQTSEV